MMTGGRRGDTIVVVNGLFVQVLAQISVCLADVISALIPCGYWTVELAVPWLGVQQAPDVRSLQSVAVCLRWLGMLVQVALEEVLKVLPQVPGLRRASLQVLQDWVEDGSVQADYSLELYGALKEVLHHRGLDGNLVEQHAFVVEPLGS